MTERALQASIIKRLRAGGGVWINKSPSPWDQEGIADILGVLGGRFIAIELKAPGRYTTPAKGLTPAQHTFLAKVVGSGGISICADSWEGVLKQLPVELASCYRSDQGTVA